jgi:hypothetical protein
MKAMNTAMLVDTDRPIHMRQHCWRIRHSGRYRDYNMHFNALGVHSTDKIMTTLWYDTRNIEVLAMKPKKR